ncbi:hypothetical protein LU276_09075 [Moraxella haemolytica]|uniref:hypothetical protein n=1 Tax=Moraxella TaxID=475 RepID=UPI002543D889|nr:hypothetical protein [Moraxella sp. ZY171148]WII95135.1 hypothetical protein LU276_09075 [Moraxella sp. ZY171148]
MKVKFAAVIAAAAVLSACATPHVVQTTKINDHQLSCAQLKSEIAEAKKFEQDARAERKVTGKNVAAALFFIPALFATYANTEEAIDAAKERQAKLTDIYNKKQCS